MDGEFYSLYVLTTFCGWAALHVINKTSKMLITSPKFIILLFYISIVISSCKSKPVTENVIEENPKALDDKNSGYNIKSSRDYDNLVESLYNELVNKQIDLKTLENKIAALNNSWSDSSSSFVKFNQKNLSYYEAANMQVSRIKDSLLRDKMKILIANNISKYNTSISKHSELLKIIESKKLTIEDLHNVLKIVKTIPLIEKYQKDNLPSLNSFEGYINEQENTIKLADTLISKK